MAADAASSSRATQVLWAVKLTECLALFDPLLILPLMVGVYILFGGIAGGIYFQEFASLHLGAWPTADVRGAARWALYISGVLAVLVGLCLIAVASAEVERELEAAEDKAADAECAITPRDAGAADAATCLSPPFRPMSSTPSMLMAAGEMPTPGAMFSQAQQLARSQGRRASTSDASASRLPPSTPPTRPRARSEGEVSGLASSPLTADLTERAATRASAHGRRRRRSSSSSSSHIPGSGARQSLFSEPRVTTPRISSPPRHSASEPRSDWGLWPWGSRDLPAPAASPAGCPALPETKTKSATNSPLVV
jgi:hypothetical protein